MFHHNLPLPSFSSWGTAPRHRSVFYHPCLSISECQLPTSYKSVCSFLVATSYLFASSQILYYYFLLLFIICLLLFISLVHNFSLSQVFFFFFNSLCCTFHPHDLFHNWNPEPPTPLPLIFPIHPCPPPLWPPSACSLYSYARFCFFCSFVHLFFRIHV